MCSRSPGAWCRAESWCAASPRPPAHRLGQCGSEPPASPAPQTRVAPRACHLRHSRLPWGLSASVRVALGPTINAAGHFGGLAQYQRPASWTADGGDGDSGDRSAPRSARVSAHEGAAPPAGELQGPSALTPHPQPRESVGRGGSGCGEPGRE